MTIMTNMTMMLTPTVVTALECSDTSALVGVGVSVQSQSHAGIMNDEGEARCAGELEFVC